ncbi:hypothetical protein DMB44_04285 [Thermoplasma sp. Kam2015]|uniref:hypothetical protein n=1 Tax=Thermoplasma sp. Kam2015 TaxID=2094122 RepID=UPI000D93EB9D|nr:hypothetical protein [Thermoplasma sp. Kam2015]PYB68559.1 hypothetical protein DMB44_04285 [Thermoplasma sp. Kam2015]
MTGANEEDYLKYLKDHEIANSKEFLNWVLTLKPKNVRDKGISQQALYPNVNMHASHRSSL